MDAIAAHEHGYSNVVASMGTALTEHQVAALRGMAGHFVLALDPDAAGQEATVRSLESSWKVFEQRAAVQGRGGVTLYERGQAGGSLRVAVLPPGEDPDQLIRRRPQEWRELMQGAKGVLDYLFGRVAAMADLSTPQGKARVAERLFPLVASVENPFEQERYFRLLAETLGVSPTTLEASVGRPLPRRGRRRAPEAAASPFASGQRDPLEEHILALLLQYPELADQAAGLISEHFRNLENQAVFTAWREHGIIDISAGLDEDLTEYLATLLSEELPPSDRGERARSVVACVRRLEERRLRELKSQEEMLWDQAVQDGEGEQAEQLQRQMVATNERLRSLFAEKHG